MYSPMRFLSTVLLALLISACGIESDPPTEPPDENNGEAVVRAFTELSFNRPVDLQHPGDQSNRLFVVEQQGIIRVFENDPETSEATVFLDIRNRVNDSENEQGLLGLAFHPDFESNGYFYVNYTTFSPDRTIISRFNVSQNDPAQADPASELEILAYQQPFGNHNGGQVAFGPDGYLYIASGDGGSGGDPQGNAQNRANLLGAILRIDVDNPQNGNQYGIPAGNPFADNQDGYREEIYAWGLRNPWRFSFDAETGELWAADVGQSDREAIHIVENGLNYGWNIIEGSICYLPETGCDTDGLEMPVYEYDHSQNDRSITGGFVYRGASIPELEGQYIYGDYISGRIWSLDVSDPDNPVNTELYHADFNISSFGVDEHNELYICAFDGNIYKLTDSLLARAVTD